MKNPHWYIAGYNNGRLVHVWRYVSRGHPIEFATIDPEQERIKEYLPRLKAYLDGDRAGDPPVVKGGKMGILPADKVEKRQSDMEILAIDLGPSQH